MPMRAPPAAMSSGRDESRRRRSDRRGRPLHRRRSAHPAPDQNRGRNQPSNEFKAYANFGEPIGAIAGNKLLALNRGERLGALRVRLEYDPKEFEHAVHESARTSPLTSTPVCWRSPSRSRSAIWRRRSKRTFATRRLAARKSRRPKSPARTVRNLLLQPGVGPERVLAIDPGLKNGCRYSVLDDRGAILDFGVVFPSQPGASAKKKKKTALATEAAVEQKVAEWEKSIADAEGASTPPGDTAPMEDVPPSSDGSERRDEPARTPAPVLPADSFYRVTSESPEGDEDQPVEPEPIEAADDLE